MGNTVRRTAVIFLILLSFLSCSRTGKVLSVNRMAEIYADMFIADQWLRDNPASRRMVDTTLFYDPIFEMHDCSREDFVASVGYYIDKPDKFSKILKRSSQMIQSDKNRFEKLSELEARAAEANKVFETYEARDFCADSLVWRSYGALLEKLEKEEEEE